MKEDVRQKRKTRLLWTIAKLVLSLGLLVYILTQRTTLHQVFFTLRDVKLGWIILSFSLHAVGLFASAYRWQILIRAQGDDVPLKFLARSYLVGTFFNNFFPTRFGGDIVRIWDGSRYSRSIVKSSAIVIVERLTGLFILFLFALLVSLIRLDLAQETPFVWVSLALGGLGFSLILIFLLAPLSRLSFLTKQKGHFGSFLNDVLSFRETILRYRLQKRAFIRAMFWAFVLQINVIVYYYFIGQSLRLDVPFLDYFMVIPVVLFIQLIPVTINGLGLREGAYIEIFKFYGIPASTAFSFSMVDVGFVLILGAIGGMIYVLRK